MHALCSLNESAHTKWQMSRHQLVQKHEASDRMNLYIASHAYRVEDVSPEKGRELLDTLYKHAQQQKYIVSVPWLNNGDLVMWDNTCVMHRGKPY